VIAVSVLWKHGRQKNEAVEDMLPDFIPDLEIDLDDFVSGLDSTTEDEDADRINSFTDELFGRGNKEAPVSPLVLAAAPAQTATIHHLARSNGPVAFAAPLPPPSNTSMISSRDHTTLMAIGATKTWVKNCGCLDNHGKSNCCCACIPRLQSDAYLRWCDPLADAEFKPILISNDQNRNGSYINVPVEINSRLVGQPFTMTVALVTCGVRAQGLRGNFRYTCGEYESITAAADTTVADVTKAHTGKKGHALNLEPFKSKHKSFDSCINELRTTGKTNVRFRVWKCTSKSDLLLSRLQISITYQGQSQVLFSEPIHVISVLPETPTVTRTARHRHYS